MQLPNFDDFKARLERLTKDEIISMVERELAAQGRSSRMNPTIRKDDLIKASYEALGGDPSAESDNGKSETEGDPPPNSGISAAQDGGDTPAPPAVEGSPRGASGADPVDAWALTKAGRWRAGLHFTEAQTFDRAKWSPEQRAAIEKDPYIRIRELRRAGE